MTDKDKKEKILKKAHELANKAELVKDKLPKSTLIAVAVDMAEWAYANPVEEPASEDLKQAIDTYLATYFGGEKEKQDWPFLKKMAIHFAEWQKEKMMKDAIDAVVKIDAGGYPYVDRTIELYDYDKDIPLAKRGDKVKLIIIKED